MNTNLSGEGDSIPSDIKCNNIGMIAVSLGQAGAGFEEGLRIDCGQINEDDKSGLQLLYILLKCLRFRGFEPELVNLSGTLQGTFQRLGFRSCF